jgi:chromosome segregation protein
MRLKRIILQGYKTFASKTEFVFDEGITSIVGPNGSGKSNIADAVRWVLGEQSYSTLRGRRTIDMIFAGTQHRSRAGMAQVMLTLDNSDGWLPVDYTEVEIGRRAYRSGENEYILNGQKVRLMDITELLATSGLAERTYTIIGQGLVDQALSLRAEERRALFEEAAGINQYKIKRAQTVRRLEETQHNLERVHDILAEIRPRMSLLKRQAARAQNYEQVATDLRHLLRIWYGYRWEQAKRELRRVRETAETVEESWKEGRLKLQGMQQKIDEERKRSQQSQAKAATIQANSEELRRKLETSRREAAVLAERQQSIRDQLAQIGRDLPLLRRQEATARAQLEQAIAELQAAQLDVAESQAQLELFDGTSGLKSVQSEARALRQRRQAGRDGRRSLTRQMELLRQDVRSREEQLNRRRTDLARMEARTELLDQLRIKESGVADNVAVVGHLANLVSVPGQYEKAIEAALQARMTTLVVLGTAELWQLVRDSDEQLPLATISLADVRLADVPELPDDPAVIDWAGRLVQCDPVAMPVAQLLLGQILLVKGDEKAAYRIAKELPFGCVVVTLSGFVAHASGLVERGRVEVHTQSLSQKREWQRAQEAQAEAAEALILLQEDVAERQASLAAMQKDADRLQAQDEELEKEQQELNQRLSQAEQQRQIWQQNVNSARTILAGRQAVVDSRRATLNHLSRQTTGLNDRQDVLGKQQEGMPLLDQEATTLQLEQQLERWHAEMEPLRAALADSRHVIMQREQELAAARQQNHHRETNYTQAKIALSQQQARLEGLQERINSELGVVALSYDEDQTGPTPLPMSDVVEQLPPVSEIPEDIEETIQHYRGQMQRMGAINPEAPTEYEEISDRYEFLSQQVEDLNQTGNQLRRIIDELDDLTSRAFVETVARVNAVFGPNFTELFGGGSARLALTDPEDSTISGVEIVARLPNRREQGLALLSGGERSLTAVALIFSLLKVSPTPFCILDEVDAALDEANINRFRELLRDLSQKTQFIIITHNRGTVQVAQTVYGISMGAEGVSQAISIRPEEYVRQESLV